MNLHFRLIVVASLLSQAAPSFGQQPTERKYATMQNALLALNHAQDDETRRQIVSALRNLQIETPEQLMALYHFAASLEINENSTNGKLYTNFTGIICNSIERASAPRFSDALAAALGKEFGAMPAHFMGEYGGQTGDQQVRSEMRERRLKTLSEAVGRIKDRQALPVLRRMLDDDGIARDLASSAIGQIGDPADLDDFINRLKKDPKARIYVAAFGPAAFDRIMKEINDPTVTPEVKVRLRSSLRYMSTSDNKGKYVELLSHPNGVVREQAATVLASNAKPGDEELIIKIAHSPVGATRLDAVNAMGGIWNDKFLPTATDLLLHDESPIVRSETAKMLGNNNVVGAIPALKGALSDRQAYVRKAAQSALDKIK